jgi:chlorobactene glucosyltransferase
VGFLGILGIVILIVGIYFLINGILNVIVLSRIKGKPILKDGPMVSVCIPARNEEDNIGKCLDSLMNQTYTNMEILVLDDNSNDRTADIINE